ncbi:MAG: hypothetical protein MZV70_05970 [Desulfobacterales bacterium]|nr:hypothetical protein [Desulfobacterales bacterium]
MEPYQWEDSHSTRYGIFIGSRSSAVKTLRRLIDVELTGHETVSLRIFQDIRLKADVTEKWNGAYRKMNPELAASFRKETPVTQSLSGALSGSYRGWTAPRCPSSPPLHPDPRRTIGSRRILGVLPQGGGNPGDEVPDRNGHRGETGLLSPGPLPEKRERGSRRGSHLHPRARSDRRDRVRGGSPLVFERLPNP